MFLVTFLRLSVRVIFLYSDMLNDWHHQKSVHFYRHYELMFVLKQFDQMLALSYQSQQQLHLLSPWLLVIFADSFYLVLVFYLLFGFQHHSSYNVPPSLFFSMFFRTCCSYSTSLGSASTIISFAPFFNSFIVVPNARPNAGSFFGLNKIRAIAMIKVNPVRPILAAIKTPPCFGFE